MHNGGVAQFGAIKRQLLFSLRERYFRCIEGSTDSELCFYLILNEIDNIVESQSAVHTSDRAVQRNTYRRAPS